MSLTTFYKPLLLQREVIKRGGKCSLNKNIRNSQEKNLKPKLTSYSNLTKFLFIQFITSIFKFVSVDKKKNVGKVQREITQGEIIKISCPEETMDMKWIFMGL